MACRKSASGRQDRKLCECSSFLKNTLHHHTTWSVVDAKESLINSIAEHLLPDLTPSSCSLWMVMLCWQMRRLCRSWWSRQSITICKFFGKLLKHTGCTAPHRNENGCCCHTQITTSWRVLRTNTRCKNRFYRPRYDWRLDWPGTWIKPSVVYAVLHALQLLHMRPIEKERNKYSLSWPLMPSIVSLKEQFLYF